jgi:hypothetical protein
MPHRTLKGPQSRNISGRYRYWGIWNFSPNKPTAKSLLLYLSSRDAIGRIVSVRSQSAACGVGRIVR